MRSSEARPGDELDEHAAGCAWVEERDVTIDTASRLAVDELDAARLEPTERAAQIVDHEADVMEGGPPSTLGEEACDTRVRVDRLDEFDPGQGRGEEHGADALVGDLVHLARVHAESVAIERQRLGDRGHDDADVVELAGFRDHPRSGGTYEPNDARRSAQISPSVTSPSTAATMSGMRFSVPSAAARSSVRSRSTRAPSRRARSVARRSRWRAATDSSTRSVVTFASSPSVRKAFTPTTRRVFVSISR